MRAVKYVCHVTKLATRNAEQQSCVIVCISKSENQRKHQGQANAFTGRTGKHHGVAHAAVRDDVHGRRSDDRDLGADVRIVELMRRHCTRVRQLHVAKE